MTHDRSGRRAIAKGFGTSRSAHIPSAITSRFAALRREQIAAARRLEDRNAEHGVRHQETCRIVAARDRRSPFVWRAPRRNW